MPYTTEEKISKVTVEGKKFEIPYDHVKFEDSLVLREILKHPVIADAEDSARMQVKLLVDGVNGAMRLSNLNAQKAELRNTDEHLLLVARANIVRNLTNAGVDKAVAEARALEIVPGLPEQSSGADEDVEEE